jgi:hypothetical protein
VHPTEGTIHSYDPAESTAYLPWKGATLSLPEEGTTNPKMGRAQSMEGKVQPTERKVRPPRGQEAVIPGAEGTCTTIVRYSELPVGMAQFD